VNFLYVSCLLLGMAGNDIASRLWVNSYFWGVRKSFGRWWDFRGRGSGRAPSVGSTCSKD
jgi:hypothetical protein